MLWNPLEGLNRLWFFNFFHICVLLPQTNSNGRMILFVLPKVTPLPCRPHPITGRCRSIKACPSQPSSEQHQDYSRARALCGVSEAVRGAGSPKPSVSRVGSFRGWEGEAGLSPAAARYLAVLGVSWLVGASPQLLPSSSRGVLPGISPF